MINPLVYPGIHENVPSIWEPKNWETLGICWVSFGIFWVSWDVMPGELSIAQVAEEVWALENVSAFHAINHHRSPLACQKVRDL